MDIISFFAFFYTNMSFLSPISCSFQAAGLQVASRSEVEQQGQQGGDTHRLSADGGVFQDGVGRAWTVYLWSLRIGLKRKITHVK